MKVIVNADDFAGTVSCTDAIYNAFRCGLITDTTMMANGAAFDRAIEYISSDDNFKKVIGVHINLTSGVPLTDEIGRCPRLVQNSQFTRFLLSKQGKLFPLRAEERSAIRKEISAQISKLKEAGIKLTHADSHQHVHTNPQIAGLVIKVCRDNGITRIRLYKNIVDRGSLRNAYYALFNRYLRSSKCTTTDWFGNICEYKKAPVKGTTIEIMVHPDYSADGTLVNRGISNGTGVTGDNLKEEMLRITSMLDVEPIDYSML